MNLPSEIAKAYVQIIPTTQGIKGTLEKELSDAGENSGGGFSAGFGAALKKGIAAIGIATLAKEAADFTKEIVSSYADYEQLTGGVETLFKDSGSAVMEYAQNAFRTAGLSANQYMETVTSFSASLLQSVGGDTAQAAQIADMAITDMADNANKMGSSIESIQNAYQGFAKQNYTMLDNLKLGYGGTKSEMERLLADATALSGVEYDLDSLSDVYEAIHVIQTELDITGTTAKEASSTISGSAASMQAAWQNLLVGMADENADFESLVGDFTESLATFAENLLPRIGVAVDGIGALLTAFAETILPQMIDYIVANLPQIVETGVTILAKLVTGLISAIPQLVAAIPDIIKAILNGLNSALPDIASVGKALIEGLWNGMQSMSQWVQQKVSGFVSGIVGGIKSLLGIHSPSRVFAGIGGYMAEGLGNGFADEMADVKREISSDVNDVVATVGSASASLNASVSSGVPDQSKATADNNDRLIAAIRDLSIQVHVLLDSREIKSGQDRLARAVG